MGRHTSVVHRSFDDEFIEVIPLGDIHWGSPHCDKEKVRGYLDWVLQKDNRHIILMGDLIENSAKNSVGAGVYEQVDDPQTQIDEILDELWPAKDRILGLLTGNHEERTYKTSGVDVSANMARTLGVPYLKYGGFIRLVVNGVGYTGYITHGASSSATTTGKRNAAVKLRGIAPDCDFYCIGHMHISDAWHEEPITLNLRNSTVGVRRQSFIITGNFLTYLGSYGQMKCYEPTKTGAPRLRFDGTRKDLHVSI